MASGKTPASTKTKASLRAGKQMGALCLEVYYRYLPLYRQ